MTGALISAWHVWKTMYVQINFPRDFLRKHTGTVADSDCFSKGGKIFLDVPGVTLYTFITKLHFEKVRQHKYISFSMALSCIAATLLPGRGTAHPTFKLTLTLTTFDKTIYGINKTSEIVQVLKRWRFLESDECTTANLAAQESLDRTMRIFRDCQSPMGVISLQLSGDFRQSLPVAYSN